MVRRTRVSLDPVPILYTHCLCVCMHAYVLRMYIICVTHVCRPVNGALRHACRPENNPTQGYSRRVPEYNTLCIYLYICTHISTYTWRARVDRPFKSEDFDKLLTVFIADFRKPQLLPTTSSVHEPF